MVPGKLLFFVMVSLFLHSAALAGNETGWFYPYVEAWTADSGPLSLPVVPDGNGPDFSEAFTGVPNQRANATITLILYDDTPPFGQVVPHFPGEDIWLVSAAETFNACPAGTIPDQDTDHDGMTSWNAGPRAGGWFEPNPGNELQVWVNGWACLAPGLSGLRFNSCDLNGDLRVSLADVALFAQDYISAYAYRSDLAWDGDLNLQDVGLLATGIGASCP